MLTLDEALKKLIPIKQSLDLKRLFSENKQHEFLEHLLGLVIPEATETDCLKIAKLYMHLLKHGASDEIKDDAFSSLAIMKSFAIKQHKPHLQHYCFTQGFFLLYSRYLTQEQQQTYINELNEYATSKTPLLRLFFLCFYMDTHANPDFNLLKHPHDWEHLDNVTHDLCYIFLYIHQHSETEFPQLNPEHPALTLTTIQQRFFNQFVYGPYGLQADPYAPTRSKIILKTLSQCQSTSIQSMATKALSKHEKYLKKLCQRYENTDNLDALINIEDDLNYLKNTPKIQA